MAMLYPGQLLPSKCTHLMTTICVLFLFFTFLNFELVSAFYMLLAGLHNVAYQTWYYFERKK